MKPRILIIAATSLNLTCLALADDYSDLAAQGYRWVTVDGPYACATKQDARRMAGHHTDAAELQVVADLRCYYLIPGAIAQVLNENPIDGMSEIRLGTVAGALWTHTRFLSKQPIRNTFGIIETPTSSGLLSKADGATRFASDKSTPEF